jgi:hypothetical protein
MLSDLQNNINRTEKFPDSAVCPVTKRSEDEDGYDYVAVAAGQGQWSVPPLRADGTPAPQY